VRLQGFFQEDHLNAWLFWKGFSMVRRHNSQALVEGLLHCGGAGGGCARALQVKLQRGVHSAWGDSTHSPGQVRQPLEEDSK
jgi:hypothetical protein